VDNSAEVVRGAVTSMSEFLKFLRERAQPVVPGWIELSQSLIVS
jgi:hypothetical protein